MNCPKSELEVRFQEINERIRHAAIQSNRNSEDVNLIAVSKTVPCETILELYHLGQRVFGESRLQDAESKIADLPANISWHFIGHLQSNKAKKIGRIFSAIHSLDSQSQISELSKVQSPIDVCIEVNMARESQKSGIFPEALDEFTQSVLNSQQLRLRGLMAIGPLDASHNEKRRLFRELRTLAGRMPGRPWLSMGMSDDYEIAIQEGSTHVRIGSALFGNRS